MYSRVIAYREKERGARERMRAGDYDQDSPPERFLAAVGRTGWNRCGETVSLICRMCSSCIVRIIITPGFCWCSVKLIIPECFWGRTESNYIFYI